MKTWTGLWKPDRFLGTLIAMDQLTTATDYLVHAAAAARAASHTLARSSRQARDDALAAMADALRDAMRAILAANAADVAAYQGTAAFLDRLTLTEARVEAMARGLEEVAALPDPLQPHPGRMDAAERPAYPADRHARSG